ncbi:MAG: hypothetical protein C5B50_29780 [Verrucomicrobia bacterium]|nr:MAG: hypothetical protein C5B50_29780 [Verrucomicrobiota bacterium]
MPEKAFVSSIEALEAFRSDLVLYISKARPALEEVSADVTRMRLWLEDDQRRHWQGELRRRGKELEQAQSALFSARVSHLGKETSAELMAVQRAKRAMDEAETKMRVLKKWDRDFESRVDPLVKQTEKLHTVLANDLVQALAYLARTIETLSAYAQVKAQGTQAPGTQIVDPSKMDMT